MSAINSLPEEMEAHLFSFLATPCLTKFQAMNMKTYKKIKACVFLRRVHSMIREYSWFEYIKFKWKSKKECRILTSIRDKLLYERGAHTAFVAQIDVNSLMDFNRSISWLERYEDDDEFIDLLFVNWYDFPDPPIWTDEEQFYIDKWLHEFRVWMG